MLIQFINQQPVWLNMAFPVVCPIAAQRMIFQPSGKWLLLQKHLRYLPKFGGVLAALLGTFGVAPEFPGEDGRQHLKFRDP